MSDFVSKIKELRMDVDPQQVRNYEAASRSFDLMISQGITSPRGYNIQTIGQSIVKYAINNN